jgi:hypothetical protein
MLVSQTHSVDDRMINGSVVDGKRMVMESRNAERESALVSLYPPQIPHD